MQTRMTFYRIPALALLLALAPLATPAKPPVPPEVQARIMEKQEIDQATLEKFLPYIYPPVQGPVAEGLDLSVPEGLGNAALAAMGMVDVTAAPFSADPTGVKDSTRALQEAVDFARDHQMAAFFPAGTYRVSDTLEYIQDLKARANGRLTSAHCNANVLIGSTKDPAKRAVIYLAPHSPGFTDERNPKIVVHILKRAYDKGFGNFDSGESFNQLFSNIDIRIGEGNSGAIGLRMVAAEGSSAQDVTIDATHGHTGMRGLAGGGGSHHHITIIGGKVGIDTRGWLPEFQPDGSGTKVTPTMAGVTLTGQTEAAVIHKSRGPLIGVGWRIEFAGDGPAIRNYRNNERQPFDSAFCLIDSAIDYRHPTPGASAITAERSFYLENVYIRNAGRLCDGGPTLAAGGWTRVARFARASNPQSVDKLVFDETPVLKGGGPAGSPAQAAVVMEDASAGPPADLQSRHLWPASFPTLETDGAVNVKQPPYNAKGDGMTDDTQALQRAVDEREVVVLPKGYYLLSDTLRLRPNTKLIGVNHNLSVLLAKSPFGALGSKPGPKPLVETANTPDAQTVLAFVGIQVPCHAGPGAPPGDVVPCYALKWQSGGDSFVRSPGIARLHIFGPGIKPPDGYRALAYEHPLVWITGTGGGKWYNFFIHGGYPEKKTYRHILISNTRSPVTFYHLHAQHAETDAQVEAVGAARLVVYGMKSENNFGFMRVKDCDSVSLYGFGGIATPPPDGAHFLFEGVRNLLFAACNDQVNLDASGSVKDGKRRRTNLKEFAPFIDAYGDDKTAIPSLSRPILYQRTTP